MSTKLHQNNSYWKAILSPASLTILLMLSQILVKFVGEFPGIEEVEDQTFREMFTSIAWIMTAGWLILVPLAVLRHKNSFIVAVGWGIWHAVAGIAPPIMGACNHWVLGPFVSVQGLFIAIFAYFTYRQLKRESSAYWGGGRDKTKIDGGY